MTLKKRLEQEHPEKVGVSFKGGVSGCPSKYGYEGKNDGLCKGARETADEILCKRCWNRRAPEPAEEPKMEKAEPEQIPNKMEPCQGWEQGTIIAEDENTKQAERARRLLEAAIEIAYACEKRENCEGCVFYDSERCELDDGSVIKPMEWKIPLNNLRYLKMDR